VRTRPWQRLAQADDPVVADPDLLDAEQKTSSVL
jgi:hypothetical protein